MQPRTIDEMFSSEEGKVSDKWSSYIDFYDQVLVGKIDDEVSLLEIGVQNGGSLEIWAQYFKNGIKFIGCDIDPKINGLTFEDQRITTISGDATAKETFYKIIREQSRFDIIIDDGSHRSDDIISAFCLYWPLLNQGGIYIVEDLHCSYWQQYEGGLYSSTSAISFFKLLVDVLNHEHWGLERKRTQILQSFARRYDLSIPEEHISSIHSIEFLNSVCLLKKGNSQSNSIGYQRIRGTDEDIVKGRKGLMNEPFRLDPSLNQESNPLSNCLAPDLRIELIEEENEKLKAQVSQQIEYLATKDKYIQDLLKEVESIVSSHKTQVSEQKEVVALKDRYIEELLGEKEKVIALKDTVINEYRMSTSWRVTRPLRFISAQSRKLRNFFFKNPGFQKPDISAANIRKLLIARLYVLYKSRLRQTTAGRWIAHKLISNNIISVTEVQQIALSSGSINGSIASGSMNSDDNYITQVPGFHLSPPLNFVISEKLGASPHINLIIPSISLRHMSGGPNTALIIAAMLVERGERVRIIASDAPCEGNRSDLYAHIDGLMKRPVRRDMIELIDAFDRNLTTYIGINDIFFATAWWTAQIAKHATSITAVKEFIYLVQDFEPILHEASTFYARALETYSFDHVPLINTSLLHDYLVSEGVGKYAEREFAYSALVFEPALDRNYYFIDSSKSEINKKKTLLFYARPNSAKRNLFEIGVVALRKAVSEGSIDHKNWDLWAIGDKLDPIPLGHGTYLNPLPWMSFEDYARKIRTSDLLLSLMLSPHPSYPPLEMAASGNIVVTNIYSVKTKERLNSLSPNIIAVDPTADCISEAISLAANRINLGLSARNDTRAIDLPSSWDDSLAAVMPALMKRIAALRYGENRSEAPNPYGYPPIPASDYEKFRRSRLACRRERGSAVQEDGLISFITSAYNTPSQYLNELASSVVLQDGGHNFEWLILDNGSTNEETRNALENIGMRPFVRILRVDHNLGIIGGMKYLLNNATGRYVLPLDSDDLVEPDCVSLVSRFLKDHNYPVALYTDEDKVSEGGYGSPYFKPDWDPVLFLHSCYIAHLCVIDREFALSIGLYSDASSEGCHDWDSFIRIMNAGYVPLHIAEVLYSWRIHSGSTSGNIESKSYISRSHLATLQRHLDHRGLSHLEVTASPLFHYNVDWRFTHKNKDLISCDTILIREKYDVEPNSLSNKHVITINKDSEALKNLLAAASEVANEYIHLIWGHLIPEDDDWYWEGEGLFHLFPDAVMVGGIVYDGDLVVGGPIIFGFGNGFDSPEKGLHISDHGYQAKIFKAHSTSAVSTAHCMIRREFLCDVLSRLVPDNVSINMLGPWLGAFAARDDRRIIFTPFMRARGKYVPEDKATSKDKAYFTTVNWSLYPDSRYYSRHFSLDAGHAYQISSERDRLKHLEVLQKSSMAYSDWFASYQKKRASSYSIPDKLVSISLITTVYEKTDFELFDSLQKSVDRQTVRPREWVIVAHGSIGNADLDRLNYYKRPGVDIKLIVIKESLGIVGAMKVGLDAVTGEYYIPIDADDLITDDAIQILSHGIEKFEYPDMIYTDEDLLIENHPCHPFLRGSFDPVLNSDSSYIWHLCAIKTSTARSCDLYTDAGATWCHDWDTVNRIHNSKGRIEHLPEVLYHWRQHGGSTTNKENGDPRSLESVRHVLQKQLDRLERPENFYIDRWPVNRGAPELYIARHTSDLPEFIFHTDVCQQDYADVSNIIVVCTSGDLTIRSEKIYVEVARIFDMHKYVSAVGGLVFNDDNTIIDACYIRNSGGDLESPWIGQPLDTSGPYALAQKSQLVSMTGKRLAFVRLEKFLGFKEQQLTHSGYFRMDVSILSSFIAGNGELIAFSPLVSAKANRDLAEGPKIIPSTGAISNSTSAYVRYGILRNFNSI